MPQMTREQLRALSQSLAREETSSNLAHLLMSHRSRRSVVQDIFDAVGVRLVRDDDLPALRSLGQVFVKTHNNIRNNGMTADYAVLRYLKTLGEKQ